MAKLVKCKSCGQEIAKTASVCPNCGAKQYQGTKIVCVIIAIFAFFVIIGIATDDGDNPSDANNSQSSTIVNESSESTVENGSKATTGDDLPVEVIKVSAEELYAAYTENAVNADNLYKNKTIEVTGEITDIGQDALTKKPCVSLSSGNEFGFYPIQCFFNSSSDEIAALRDGDNITITGKCSGYSVAFVQLTGCELN